jgi:flagella basal body P-ring formation protein FlgA
MLMRTTRSLLSLLFTATLVAMPGLRAADAADSNPVPAAVPLAHEEFVTALSRDLCSHYSLEGDLEIDLPRAWVPPDRVAHSWQVQLGEYPALPAGSMLVHCRLLADGEVAADSALLLHASLWRDVWLARQPLGTGMTFDPTLLDTRRVDLLRERDVIPAAVGDRTFVFIRSVQAGQLLTWRDLARRPLIRKGDVVEVSASEGMLSVTMKALAMQNGAMGEAVTVRNLDSRKDFTAFVVDENHVQVRF